MKKTTALICLAAWLAFMLCGCRIIRIEEEERKPLEYKVMNQQELPSELRSLIDEKKAKEFQMIYQSGEEMYLIRGYGQQMSGGYSIQVMEVSQSSNGIFFASRLLGPEDDSLKGEPSYPYIAVKIKYQDQPVIFE